MTPRPRLSRSLTEGGCRVTAGGRGACWARGPGAWGLGVGGRLRGAALLLAAGRADMAGLGATSLVFLDVSGRSVFDSDCHRRRPPLIKTIKDGKPKPYLKISSRPALLGGQG